MSAPTSRAALHALVDQLAERDVPVVARILEALQSVPATLDGAAHLAELRALGLSEAELFTDAGLTDVTAEQNAAWLEGRAAWPWPPT